MSLTMMMLFILCDDPTTKYPEPPQLFFLESGSKQLPLELDKSITLEELGAEKTATLRVKPYREFVHEGLKFRYPRDLTYLCVIDKSGLIKWDLQQGDFNLFVFLSKDHNDPQALVAAIQDGAIEAMKEANARITTSSTSLKLASGVVKGTRVVARTSEEKPRILQEDFFACRRGDDSLVLVLSDVVSEPGNPTKERKRVEQLLAESLQWPASVNRR